MIESGIEKQSDPTAAQRKLMLVVAFLGWFFGGVQIGITGVAMRDAPIELMDRTGRSMAAGIKADPEASFADRVRAATDFADNLGADTETELTDEGITIRSFSCPLGRGVRAEPCVCGALARFFAEVTGGEVDEQCERGDRLACKFVIKEPA